MDDIYDFCEVLVSFVKAWVCTIAASTGYLPGSKFVRIPFAGGSIFSLCVPGTENTSENDKVYERHQLLYSWLSERACDELKGDEEKCIVLWITDEGCSTCSEEEDIMADHILLGAYVIQCSKDERFEQDDRMIRKKTRSILKAVRVCSLTHGELPDCFGVDLEVWKGADELRNVQDLVLPNESVEHGRFRVGHWEIYCWMVILTGCEL